MGAEHSLRLEGDDDGTKPRPGLENSDIMHNILPSNTMYHRLVSVMGDSFTIQSDTLPSINQLFLKTSVNKTGHNTVTIQWVAQNKTILRLQFYPHVNENEDEEEHSAFLSCILDNTLLFTVQFAPHEETYANTSNAMKYVPISQKQLDRVLTIKPTDK